MVLGRGVHASTFRERKVEGDRGRELRGKEGGNSMGKKWRKPGEVRDKFGNVAQYFATDKMLEPKVKDSESGCSHPPCSSLLPSSHIEDRIEKKDTILEFNLRPNLYMQIICSSNAVTR